MSGVGSWEGGWKFRCPKLYFLMIVFLVIGFYKVQQKLDLKYVLCPMQCCVCLLQYARAPVNTEIWWSAQGRVHLLCRNPAFWDVVLLRQCIHMTHTMYLPPRCADPPQHEPKTGSWKSKVCMLSFWSGFLSHTYDRQKRIGRNWAYFRAICVRRKEAITRNLMKKCPKYSEYPEDWSVLLSVFPLQKTSETHKM